MHRNSLDAYFEELEAGNIHTRRSKIIALFFDKGTDVFKTDRDVQKELGYSDMNAVRPRITELVKEGILSEGESVVCDVTGKTVRTVGLVNERTYLPLPFEEVFA